MLVGRHKIFPIFKNQNIGVTLFLEPFFYNFLFSFLHHF